MIKRSRKYLNYFGFGPNYVPERAWTTIEKELQRIMRNAKQQSDNVNNILSKIDNVDVLSSGFAEIQRASVIPFQEQLKETRKLVKLNKNLKKSTITVRISI